MIIFKGDKIGNFDGRSKQIEVRLSDSKNSLRDLIIGGGLSLVGICYLAITSFRNGAQGFQESEIKTMKELDLI